MKKMYLVQTGKRNVNMNEATSLTGRGGLYSLNYMGSAEFEWGALPRAFRRILAQREKYKVVDTGRKNINGLTLYLFCNEENEEEVKNILFDYMENWYDTKEVTGLKVHFTDSRGTFSYHCDIDKSFWWDIRNDFIIFVGCNDVKENFERCFENDYQEVWSKMSDSEKEEVIDSIERRRY